MHWSASLQPHEMEKTCGTPVSGAAATASTNSYCHAASVQYQFELSTPTAPMYCSSSDASKSAGALALCGPMFLTTFHGWRPAAVANVVTSVGWKPSSRWNSAGACVAAAEPGALP